MNDYNARGLDTSSTSGSGAVWFIAGALVGAAAALMFAPATGPDARAYLGRRGKQLADDVTEQGRRMANEAAERGKQLWNEHGDRVTSAVKKGYERASNAVAETVNNGTETGQAM